MVDVGENKRETTGLVRRAAVGRVVVGGKTSLDSRWGVLELQVGLERFGERGIIEDIPNEGEGGGMGKGWGGVYSSNSVELG